VVSPKQPVYCKQRSAPKIIRLVTTSELPREENELGQELLSNRFGLPSWFWTVPTQEASGFFHARYIQQPNESKPDVVQQPCGFKEVHITSRFLIKHYRNPNHAKVAKPADITYYWERLSFFCRWRSSDQSEVLCFLPAGSQSRFKQFAFEDNIDITPSSPFTPHTNALKHVVSGFHDAVWSWRDAVRDCERARLMPTKIDSDWVANMHEIARHVIHTSEMLEMAIHVTQSLIDEANTLYRERRFPGPYYLNESCDMKYSKTMLQCQLLRSQALEKRIQNELQLVRDPN